MSFHFAWVDPNQTSFSSAFAREDEQVLSFEIAQEEGDFASLRLEVRNPRVGLLAIGRKRWAWLSVSEGSAVTPMFFGRLIGFHQRSIGDVSMFTSIDKALVAAIMGILFIVQTYKGFSMAWATPDTIATIIGLITPVLVWAIPNKKVA
jgi:hypothetical protein